MKGKLLEDISLAHQDALEADQKSPRTIRYYRQRQEATLRDLDALLGRADAGGLARPGRAASALLRHRRARAKRRVAARDHLRPVPRRRELGVIHGLVHGRGNTCVVSGIAVGLCRSI